MSRYEAGTVENQAPMTQFFTRNLATLVGMQFLSFLAITSEKMFRSNFDNFSKPGHHRSKQSWKQGPDDSILHPRHTHTVRCAILIIFR